MKTHVLMFEAQFADDVESGHKLQTVRPPRENPIVAGDRLDLRAWAGVAYRSKQRVLRTVVCSSTRRIEIQADGMIWLSYPNFFHSPAETDRFAKKDGSRNLEEMLAYFEANGGLPFTGDLIRWTI